MKYTISIDRSSKSYTVFQKGCLTPCFEFEQYDIEQAALLDARRWCSQRGDENPEVVYPRITKLSMR